MLLIAAYTILIAVICIYGLHRYWMVWQCLRCRRVGGDPVPNRRYAEGELPMVTVQLPMFNEQHVAERIIEAAAALDFPRDRLQIQVLDDSTDESADIARTCCQRIAGTGIDIEYIHRADRTGYKAGALDNGLKTARGELIAVFDADFVPPSQFLRQVVDHFADDSIGMVQTRWAHLNRRESPLTEVQALFLDGHFIVEQAARSFTGRWFNFNGTAGLWRRQCIDDAGGWQFDTLTEDTDLSYRAQLRGWDFRYLNDVCCPAELPPTVRAFLNQQHRWNKGLTETAIKLLPTVLRSDAPVMRKIESWFHLTAPCIYVAMLLVALLIPATIASTFASDPADGWLVFSTGLLCLVLGTAAAGSFYLVSQLVQRQSLARALVYTPLLMAVGVGISVTNAGAILAAVLRRRSPFIRTPKYNTASRSAVDPLAALRRCVLPCGMIELALAAVMTASIAAALTSPIGFVGTPFMALFAVGFGIIAWGNMHDRRPRAKQHDDRAWIDTVGGDHLINAP